MIVVRKFSIDKSIEWNSFLEDSKNQSFLFSRDFMDYHADRFTDYSLMVYEDNKLVSLIPANMHDKVITSHQGLTYGGMVVKSNTRSIKTIEYFYNAMRFFYDNGIQTFNLKQVPAFYNEISGDEVDYALFLMDASLYRMDIASVINQQAKIEYQERRKRSVKKAIKLNVQIVQETNCISFWNEILRPNLMHRFGVEPVHSLKEITSLMTKNQANIKQFNAYLNGEIMAGTTIFETPLLAHAQYISASEEGRKNGALDLLFDQLINLYYSDKKYFDFGIVNELEGRQINNGLLDWKEGFGGRSYSHKFYIIETKNYTKLEAIL
jgi:hypothetical protein